MFDHTLLDKARARLGGDDAFPEVYDKVRSEDGISDLTAELAQEKLVAGARSGAAPAAGLDGKKGR